MVKGNKRLDTETFSAYRERLKREKIESKYRLRRIWASLTKGTYVRRQHGLIGRKLIANQ
jgi:hypothetical protein